jgi:hypothetical protein
LRPGQLRSENRRDAQSDPWKYRELQMRIDSLLDSADLAALAPAAARCCRA